MAANENPLNEPVANIIDGWVLKNGQLYLIIRCADGAARTITLPRSKKLDASAIKPATATLEWLIADAKSRGALIYASDGITSANFPEVGVRGQLELVKVDLGRWPGTQRVLDSLNQLGYYPATMYEGAYYAANGWDGQTSVAILGSAIYGGYCLGTLWPCGTKGNLSLHRFGSDSSWNEIYHFLAIRK